MTMIRVIVGIDPISGQPTTALVHPFLAGARKRPIALIPEVYVTSKTKRGVPAFRVPAEGSDRPVPKRFGKREQERAKRKMKNA